jgi:hypothetical protein
VTLVSSIILDAFRESNMLPLGKDPTSNQSAEALRLYNALLTAIFGGAAGERLEDWPLGNFDRDPNGCQLLVDDARKHPRINHRLIAVNTLAMTVWLTARPQDGSRMGIVDPYNRLAAVPVTLDGNGRPIEGAASIVLNVNGTNREWIYRADLGAWLKISSLIATNENPFPPAFDMMFSILLAMRLNPRYGRTLDEQSAAMLKENRREFIARYLQSQPLEIDDSISWPFMSRQGFDTQRAFSSREAFDRGDYRG